MRIVKDNVVLRSVEVEDAEFILSLRKNDNLNKFLSPVVGDVESQISWIRDYKTREEKSKEFYFIIEDIYGTKYGTLRAYDIKNDECMWGSYVLVPERPENFSYKSAKLLFEFLFNTLGMKKIKMEVFKENTRSIHVCSNMGFVEFDSDESKIYMQLIK